MPERPRPESGGSEALLREIVADQAKSNARFEEVFRRLKDVEGSASEARDIGKEVLTVLREQDALARIEQVRADVIGQVAALRQDTVHANKTAREHLDVKVTEFDVRIEALEQIRDRGTGRADAVRLAFDIIKFLAGGVVGGLILKLIGG